MGTKKDDSKKNNEAGGKRFTFSLSLSAIIGISTVLVISIVWAFVFGLIVGRGYQPEEVVPELKHIMPENKPVAEVAPLRNTSDARKGNTLTSNADNAAKAGTQGSGESDNEEILKPEELDFFEQLKKKPEAPAPRVVEKPAPKPAAKPEPRKPQAPKPVPKEEHTDETVFDYTYQLAAFRDNSSAKQFAGRVNDLGYRTVIRSGMASGVRWYRVFVLFRGTPEQTRGMKADMLTLGVKKPLLKGKEAVNR